MRKRSAELAKELAEFNKALRAIRDKQKANAEAKIAALAPAPAKSEDLSLLSHPRAGGAVCPTEPPTAPLSIPSSLPVEILSPEADTGTDSGNENDMSEMARAIKALELLLPESKGKVKV